MKTNIEILEKAKQEEIIKILKIILEIGENHIKPEMIILFGDYIKGNNTISNLVREGDQIIEYKTVIEVFIVTRKPAQEKNMRLSREIISKIKCNINITNPVNIIIEDIFTFNQGIRELMYFYLDIIREGVLLYDSKKYKIKEIKKLTKKEIKQIQKEDFKAWFGIAGEFFIDYKNAYDRRSYKIAIFYLHQSTELFITCYLLVKIGYKPKTHDLEILYSKLKQETKEFNNLFDLDKENYYFQILRGAYINSRYKKYYLVKKNDVLFLEEKINILGKIVKKLCLIELQM